MSELAVTLTVEQLEKLVERAVRRVVPPGSSEASQEVLTREQLADLLQVDPHHVAKLVRRGLPGHRLGKQWRFRRSEVLAWLATQKGTS